MHDFVKWSDKKNVTIVAVYHGSEVQAIIKKGERKTETCVYDLLLKFVLMRKISSCSCTWWSERE
jgi:hypothetical protein